MSPPLVVAFALAGRVNIDMARDPIGTDTQGKEVYLKDLWPTTEEIHQAMATALKPEVFRQLYADFASDNPLPEWGTDVDFRTVQRLTVYLVSVIVFGHGRR